MACETLSTLGQGCLNIPLIRGYYRQVPIYIRYSLHGYYSDWKQVTVDITA